MPDIIKLLPDSIANQIAAGEVIQRPASVVKELMENALDAGAGEVRVIIREAGKSLIQVVDNGMGMTETDARMSFERHATSKIRSSDDLFAIRTMGFRGEALASIAAVAQVDLRTRPVAQAVGTRILIEGSVVKTQEPCQMSEGTNIAVKNLFYNVPARRKFLKSDPVEFKHIMDEFSRVALAHPEVAFALFHNDAETLMLPKSNFRQRAVNLLGKKYNELLVPVAEETNYVEISGFVGKPEAAKKTRGDQFLFVNRRFIKSPYLYHAVRSTYSDMISEDAHPMYVLYLEVDPGRIDVNVHPTKQEIKFEDERLIYNYLRVSIRHALGKYSITPSLDFEQEQAFNPERGSAPLAGRQDPLQVKAQRMDNLKNWQMLYEGLSKEQPEQQDQETLLAVTNEESESVPLESLQIHGTFVVAQTKSGMLIIDQQAAHRRVLYEYYLSAIQHESGGTQKTLFPETVEFSAADAEVLKQILPDVNRMGFDIQEFGGTSFVIHGAPAMLKDQAPVEVLERLVIKYTEATGTGLGLKEKVAKAMSETSALRYGMILTGSERIHLVDALFACENPYTSPGGKRCFVIVKMDELFDRLAKA